MPEPAPNLRAASSARARPSHEQHGFRWRFDWGEAGTRVLAGQADVVIIVDVLSFSTAVSVAIERGAVVVPGALHDGAGDRGGDGAGERGASLDGLTVASPDRRGPGPTLSPASLSVLGPGERLLLPSPNGAACTLLAAGSGAIVIAGCLRNASAVARTAAALGWTTAVIAAGERWSDGSLRPGVEDLLGAGAILDAADPASLSPEARAAAAAYRDARDDIHGRLVASASGRELIDSGFLLDVAIAADVDATGLIPVLTDGAFTAGG